MQEFDALLAKFNYCLKQKLKTGQLFEHNSEPFLHPAIILDTSLFSFTASQHPYVEYTSLQNRLMHQYCGVFRFCVDDHKLLKEDLELFLNKHNDDVDIRLFGADRTEKHLDPTPPEYNFAAIFEQVFGGKSVHALKAEVSYIDRAGIRRFIDYELSKQSSKIAIELNGERYHHPLLIDLKKYRTQLFKQNSLVSDGIKVFRWSNNGMADNTKVSDQLRQYFGSSEQFVTSPSFLAQRNMSSIELYEHQEVALERIEKERKTGKNTFLVVLPTGTGKTEVFIEDMSRQFDSAIVKKALVLVPTKELRKQTIKRIKKQKCHLKVGNDLQDNDTQVIVQTNSFMLRHYHRLFVDSFDYILVDEAHRAAAHGLRKVLEHFNPKSLVGLTATDERLDKQKLEDIFGRYEIDLTLEQAIVKGIVPPIRSFRLQSNIDLSEVRFNGKDYVKSDLNKTVIVPSRDQLIVDMLLKYFSQPLKQDKTLSQGLVFCVDIKHTQRMAKLLNEYGISAASVHGTDRKGLIDYEQKKVRFLCACELLNEGWDAPQTEIIVMARPTMSKVLYTQQLGRGTRRHPNKEALYVIDVVDSYGAALQPFSVHSLLQMPNYMPFADVIAPQVSIEPNELILLEGLFEGERRLEPINIFNFEKEFGDLINEEQLARELFISTGTLKSWIKKGDVQPTKSIPFGRKKLNFFEPDIAKELRQEKGLKDRTEESRHDDFFEFLEQGDYTFSYKIVFLLSFIKNLNEQGEATLKQVTEAYQGFYQSLYQRFNRVEKGNNPLNDSKNLDNQTYIQRSMLQNPFEKFERKRFMYQCKDLALISFDAVLWEKLEPKDFTKIKEQLISDGINYFGKHNINIDESAFKNII